MTNFDEVNIKINTLTYALAPLQELKGKAVLTEKRFKTFEEDIEKNVKF